MTQTKNNKKFDNHLYCNIRITIFDNLFEIQL